MTFRATWLAGIILAVMPAFSEGPKPSDPNPEFYFTRLAYNDTRGSGPGGLKAVAPTGTEPITIVVTEDDAKDGVSILGEKLSVVRVDGADTFTAPGRPIAVISNVMLEYRPAPAAKPAPARRR